MESKFSNFILDDTQGSFKIFKNVLKFRKSYLSEDIIKQINYTKTIDI